MRNELGRLHAVHKQFKLRQLKVARGDIVAGALALALHDVKPEYAQRLKVRVYALALGGNVVLRKLVYHILHGKRVVLVAPLKEHLHQIQKLQLLI